MKKITFDRACTWLRDNILSKASMTFDMTQLSINFSKIDNTKFTDLPPALFVDMPITGTENICDMTELKNKFANIMVQRPFTIDIKLKFTYRLPIIDNISI